MKKITFILSLLVRLTMGCGGAHAVETVVVDDPAPIEPELMVAVLEQPVQPAIGASVLEVSSFLRKPSAR